MANYSRISLGTLKTRLSDRLGANVVFWSEKERGYAINEAIRVWAALTGQWMKAIATPTLAGQTFYAVPKQIVSLQRVRYNGAVLDQTSLFELDNGVSNWQGTAAATPKLWAPVGLNLVALYPATPAGGSLSMEGIGSAPYILADGEFIDLGDEEIGRVLDYAHFYLTYKEGGLELQSALPLFTNFMESAVLRNKRLRASGYFRKYLGEVRDETQREPRPGGDSIGARG